MEKNNEASINNFCNELGSLNIYDHLDKRLTLFHKGGGLKTALPCEKLKYFFGHNRL